VRNQQKKLKPRDHQPGCLSPTRKWRPVINLNEKVNIQVKELKNLVRYLSNSCQMHQNLRVQGQDRDPAWCPKITVTDQAEYGVLRQMSLVFRKRQICLRAHRSFQLRALTTLVSLIGPERPGCTVSPPVLLGSFWKIVLSLRKSTRCTTRNRVKDVSHVPRSTPALMRTVTLNI
jgi:hypothetical protein